MLIGSSLARHHQQHTLSFFYKASSPRRDRTHLVRCAKAFPRSPLEDTRKRDVPIFSGWNLNKKFSLKYAHPNVSPVSRAHGKSSSVDVIRDGFQQFGEGLLKIAKIVYVSIVSDGRARLCALVTLLLALVTAIINTWYVGHINRCDIPAATARVAAILEREVDLGKVRWIMPTGVFGLTPLASIGPVQVPSVLIGYNLVRSVLQGEIVMYAAFSHPELKLVQGNNFSWFGRPQDTTPSSIDFFPGLKPKDASRSEVGHSSSIAELEARVETINPLEKLNERRESQYFCSTSCSTDFDALPIFLKKSSKLQDYLKTIQLEERKKFETGLLERDIFGVTFSPLKIKRTFGSLTSNKSISNQQEAAAEKRNTPEEGVEEVSVVKEEEEVSVVKEEEEVSKRRRHKLHSTPKETSHGRILKRRLKVAVEREESERDKSSEEEKSNEEVREGRGGDGVQEEGLSEEGIKKEKEKKEEVKGERQERKKTTVHMPELKQVQNEAPTVSVDIIKTWISAGSRHFLRNVKLPQVALGYIKFTKGSLFAFFNGEDIARELVDVHGALHLHANYDSLFLDLHGRAHKRNPELIKCTMISKNGPRHLRFVTPGAQNMGYNHVFPGDITPELTFMQQQQRSVPEKEHRMLSGTESPMVRPLDHCHHHGDSGIDEKEKGNEEDKRNSGSDEDQHSHPPPPSIGLSSLSLASSFQGVHWKIGREKYEVKRSPPKKFSPPYFEPRRTSPVVKKKTEGRPQGGRLDIKVKAKDIDKKDKMANLEVYINAKEVHAPILERALEIPMDIHEGTLDGNIKIHSFDKATWAFPKMNGNFKCRNLDFHIWDSPDHISKSNFDILLENNRLYFHNASGIYGAVPLVITGDMDVDPEKGQYRLSATVPAIELNVVRASLGARPLPNPAAGAAEALIYCTGPLREPSFTGRVNALKPSKQMLRALEDSNAKSALLSLDTAVAAFDKVPFTALSAIFTHNTATDVFTLHEFVAEPAGGGLLRGYGEMWLSPAAETDPKAISMQVEGHEVSGMELINRYLPTEVVLPEVLDCEHVNLKATMRGSHASPNIQVAWEAPTVQAEGSMQLSRSSWKATARAPSFEIDSTLHTKFPDFQLSKTIYTQDAMTLMSKPLITGVDADVNTKGCDVMPLLSNSSNVNRVTSRQAVRLRLNGRMQVSARQDKEEEGTGSEQRFSGEINLQGLRLNQVNLARQLTGSLDFNSKNIKISAKGQRADELMDIELNFPKSLWQDGSPVEEALEPLVEIEKEIESKIKEAVSEEEKESSEEEAIENEENQISSVKEEEEIEEKKKEDGGHFTLRQGKLMFSTEVNSSTSRVQMSVCGLTLDELELASLRGYLKDASLDLNFDARQGRGEIQMITPRYSGLRGEHLSAGIRWEREVVRLEKMILQQHASRYEIQGEYSLPPNIALPKTAAFLPSLATQQTPGWSPDEVFIAATTEPSVGRWRLQVNVPNADVQEILPAGRLLQRATRVTERTYEQAKEEFLRSLNQDSITSTELRDHIKGLLKEAEAGREPEKAMGAMSGLPGIQSLRGKWSGTLQAFGGGGGASTLNFNIRGHSWQWGEYTLDQAIARGSYHSSEGVHLEDVSLRTGEAHFIMRGDLMGPKQDATIALNDFPAALLSPIYKAVPALQNAVPAMTDHTLGLRRFLEGWEKTKDTLGLHFGKEISPMQRLTKGSPVSGMLFVRGSIGGSASSPEGKVSINLYDGFVGPTRLSSAAASLKIDTSKEIHFKIEATPFDRNGFLKVEGTLPFLQDARMNTKGNADVLVHIQDGGMSLFSAMIPDFRWENGSADINLRVKGPVSDPEIEGKARIGRATMSIPNLRYPLKSTVALVKVENGRLTFDHFESKSGNHGHIRAKGSLPLLKRNAAEEKAGNEIRLDLSHLELKVNSTYNGRLDSSLRMTRCLKEPVISGDIKLSRGIISLQYGALAAPSDTVSANGSKAQNVKIADFQMPDNFPWIVSSPSSSLPFDSKKPLLMDGVHLQNLRLVMGPELRFQVPLVVNLLISGSVEVSGSPYNLMPIGSIQINGGMVNLLATQLTMDRDDIPGRITFVPDQSFDPNVDITFTSTAEGFKAICKGRASTWQENLVVRYRGAEGTDEVRLSQAANMFQQRLADALVAENGQLTFLNLAASTMATMSPRLDTWGQIGAATWRLVSAPNIPNLLTTSERLDLQNIVTSLLSGTEIEVQYGPIQAVMAHKMHGSDFGMQWNISLNLTDNLRLSAAVVDSPFTTTSLLLQYSSEGRPSIKRIE